MIFRHLLYIGLFLVAEQVISANPLCLAYTARVGVTKEKYLLATNGSESRWAQITEFDHGEMKSQVLEPILTYLDRDLDPEKIIGPRKAWDWESQKELARVYQELLAHGQKQRMAFINDAVNFAVNNMAKRRNWPPSFFTKLRSIADKHKDSSVYFRVLDSNGKMMGTARLIKTVYFDYRKMMEGVESGKIELMWRPRFLDPSLDGFRPLNSSVIDSWTLSQINLYFSKIPEGQLSQHRRPPDLLGDFQDRLPMEEYLDILVDRPSVPVKTASHLGEYEQRVGQAIEIGNFAIDRQLKPEKRQKVFAELFAQFWNYMMDQGEDFPSRYQPAGQGFFTYADSTSFAMYRKLGFKKMTEKPILKDGVEWWPLVLRGADLEKLRADLSKIGKAERLNQRIEGLVSTP